MHSKQYRLVINENRASRKGLKNLNETLQKYRPVLLENNRGSRLEASYEKVVEEPETHKEDKLAPLIQNEISIDLESAEGVDQ